MSDETIWKRNFYENLSIFKNVKICFQHKKFSIHSEQLKDSWSFRDHYAFLIILTELKIRSIISKRNINVNVLCNIFLQKKLFFKISVKRGMVLSSYLFLSCVRSWFIPKYFQITFFPLSLSTSGPAFYRDEEFKFEIREVRKVNLAG